MQKETKCISLGTYNALGWFQIDQAKEGKKIK